MAKAWFRVYDEVLDDPKVQSLEPELFKAWINLLCLAARNDGRLPQITDIAFALRVDITVAERWVERLSNGGLIDRVNGGPNGWHNAPHGWRKRQYKSDTSTERVKRFRNARATATVTPPDTDTDTDNPPTPQSEDSPPQQEEMKEAVSQQGRYAFEGGIVRLNHKDFAAWSTSYHGIADMRAELQSIDDWWSKQPPEKQKRWFHATSGMLKRKHEEALAQSASAVSHSWAVNGDRWDAEAEAEARREREEEQARQRRRAEVQAALAANPDLMLPHERARAAREALH